ncbi:DUF4442 domain-containing protein [Marinobacterium arenosum]|uniref:DUF4442 domain-containing protein n=1 Tax=Marinobacterium arenosum TaxID=2862496 RepID=UPI001C9674CB|nr:DUF4442 domain-containing protein [Marinobacterium arenosum]MBY4678733.1 DUF4442 domain-containing protein [Marinobacterium arenosum]
MRWTPRLMKFLLNIYGPYLGAGVKTDYISADWREARVSMKLRWYNRNVVGTHFGGSLYSMVDPQLMLMLMQLLGKEYVVWDKSAAIEFVRPGRGTVRALIQLDDRQLEEIRSRTANGEKYLPSFEVQVVDQRGELVARVDKVLYVRCKQRQTEAKQAA